MGLDRVKIGLQYSLLMVTKRGGLSHKTAKAEVLVTAGMAR